MKIAKIRQRRIETAS